MLEDEMSRSESSPSASGEEQRTSTNSSVTNDTTRVMPKGHLVADTHSSKLEHGM